MTRNTFFTLLISAAATAASALIVGGCGAVDGNGDGETELRVLHLSSDAPPVDVFVDGAATAAIPTLSFGQSSDYVELEAGPRRLDVGTTGSADSAQLKIGEVDLGPGRYTAIAINRVANIEAILFPDSAADLGDNDIRVRAIHAAADVGQVDILNIDANGSISELTKNLDFGDFSDPLDLPAAAYTIGVDLDNDERAELFFELPALEAGTLANVFVTLDSSNAVVAYAQLEGPTTAAIVPATTSIRVVHGSRDAPAVDVRANGAAVLEGLLFPSSSESLVVPAGGYDLEVLIAGTETVVIDAPGASFLPSRSYTIIAYGDVGPSSTGTSLRAAIIKDDVANVEASDVRLQVFHAAPSIEEGDVYGLNSSGGADSNLVPDLGFGDFGSTPDLPRAPTDVGFEANSSGLIIAGFAIPALTVESANVFIIQDGSENVFLLAQLAGSNTALLCENSFPGPCQL